MTVELVREVLGWCSVINIAMLIVWGLMFMMVHDLIYKFHSKWFKLSVEEFDSIHYKAIAFYKLSVFVFNIVPYIALCIVGS